MGKNKKNNAVVTEAHLHLPAHKQAEAAATPVIDTHTHLMTTFSAYKSKYHAGKYDDLWAFVRGMYEGRNVSAIVDVWCEAPVRTAWKEVADSALSVEDRERRWGGIEYWFVLGESNASVSGLSATNEARRYTDEVESHILEAMTHPRCVGWGEIGLDYHYDNSVSNRQLQQKVFTRQLRHAVKLGRALTIHTREAEEDTERILKEEVPAQHKIHIHCFTDSPAFAQRLLDHFPNLYIGITGVITYTTNLNTSDIVRQMAMSSQNGPRILLETDAPFMVPSNIYASLPEVKGRLPLCHTAMIPWTADFTAGVAKQGWDAAKLMTRANDNARLVYGI
ncbi:hypothetical protein F5I97DRAFT_1807266 [Phlebopus sp. FC_14]|nr:hypothetical protein F5I97DRAFT_1807266 [Phlebopus sp. FC_14]